MSIENPGKTDLIWKIKTKHGLRVDPKTRGILSARESIGLKISSTSSASRKILIITAKGRFGKISRQRMKVVISSRQ